MSAEAWWQALMTAQTAITVCCAALVSSFFARQWQRERISGRRMAAATLALIALGAATQALAMLGGHATPLLALSAGLPACAGQCLAALLVLRQMKRV